MTARFLMATLACTAAACGGAHTPAPDTAAFSATASDLSIAAEAHLARMQQAGAGGCATETARYAGEARPLVDRMSGMSQDMDACMTAMGHTSSADMKTTCEQMRQELEAHLAAVCASADPMAETERHVAAMQQMAAHEMDRATTMHGMMGGSGGMTSSGCSM
ncbi:MAG TPA: hypothetical protein VFP65_06145 [Anaeromyxobacteraceae bacterium]|nr:hypothetical protein [Anaeromyxobacteraceae bacterium]